MKKIFLMVAIFTFCVINGAYAGGIFSTDTRVNNVTDNFQGVASQKTSVVVANGLVYTAWMDARNFSSDSAEFQKADIYFAKFAVDSNGTLTGGSNVKVNDISGSVFRDEQSRPSMAVGSNDTILIVWSDSRNVASQLEGDDIYLARSTDGGATFQPSINISSHKGFSSNPVVAVSGSNVYVLYEHCCDPANDVLKLSISSDNGASFAPPVTLEDNGAAIDHAVDPAIAVQGDSVYIVYKSWRNTNLGEIFFMASNDAGASFSSPRKISIDEDNGSHQFPAIAVASNHIYVIWYDTASVYSAKPTGTIVMTKSNDGGNSFSDISSIIPGNRLATDGSITAYGDTVAVTYSSSSADSSDHGVFLYYLISQDAGKSWSDEMVVADTTVARPIVGPSSVSIDGNQACVLWTDGLGSSSQLKQDVYLDCYTFQSGSSPDECLPGLKFISTEFDGCVMKMQIEYGGQSYCLEYKLNLKTLGFDFTGFCQ